MNAACQICDRQRAVLTHHIVRRSQLKKNDPLLTDPSNLMLLCNACHMVVHNNTAWAYEHGYLRHAPAVG